MDELILCPKVMIAAVNGKKLQICIQVQCILADREKKVLLLVLVSRFWV